MISLPSASVRLLAGCMGFVWLHADLFLPSVASPFHSFVTISLPSAYASCCTRQLTVLPEVSAPARGLPHTRIGTCSPVGPLGP